MPQRIRTAGLDSVTGQHVFYKGSAGDTIMGAPTPVTIEIDLGSVALKSGNFQITGLINLDATRTVTLQQAPDPYTGKGTLADEAEMDQCLVTGYIFNTTSIQCYWVATGLIRGNVKFIYQVITPS